LIKGSIVYGSVVKQCDIWGETGVPLFCGSIYTMLGVNPSNYKEDYMSLAKVIFKKCIQDSQEYGSNDEYMVSRVFFDINIDGKEYKDLYVNIKQIVGSNYETSPLEIGRPNNYKGPLNYDAFRDAVEKYYRSLVGRHGSVIRISGGGNIGMHGNVFNISQVVEFEIEDNIGGW